MFRRNSRNSFMQKTCPNLSRSSLDINLQEVFFRHLKETEKDQQVFIVNEFNDFKKSVSKGFADIGLEILVLNLRSQNISEVSKSLNLLIEELKNPVQVNKALKFNIVNILACVLTDFKNYVSDDLMKKALQLLSIVSFNPDAVLIISQNESLIDAVINLMYDKELWLPSSEVLQVLTSNTYAVDRMLKSFKFYSQIVMLAKKSKPTEEVFDSVANCIARNREVFATSDIFKTLLQHAENSKDCGNVMKCLALIVSCDQGLRLAANRNLLALLIFILLDSDTNQNVLVHSIDAFKNLLMDKKTFGNLIVPWKQITKLLVKHSFSKSNAQLQESSLQALRFLSCKESVKRNLRKLYKCKLQRIICLNENAEKFKNDLIQYLNYRNYKPHKPTNYSKLFI